jgi:outer membrane receptor protein involved in Fe transport
VSGAYRNADSYQAPAGSFGDLTLAGDTPVNDTGIEDHHVTAYVGYRAPRHHGVFFKFARYRANDAGFGFVDPSDLGEEGATLQLLFPNRRFERYTAGYDASDLSAPIADVVRVVAYLQNNERQFNTNVTGPLGPPGAQLEVRSENFTDLETYGFRVEAQKTVSGLHRITYGVDLFRDRSTNNDTSTTTITGFGPPSISGRGTPRVPNATFRSLGSFVQAELTVTDRATVTIGGRYQDVRAATRETPGIDDPFFEAIDRTVVATGNVAYRVTDHLNALASIGRAFRSPNLVERFFTGPSPEGRAVWVRNPDLQAETSLNLEIGAKYLAANVRIEGYIFRNTIYDGIRREPTGNTVNNRPELRNVNVEKLRYTGIELSGEVDLIRSVTVGAHLTQVDATNALEPDMPLGDSYSSKLGAHLRYRDPNGRFWVQYGVRRNGEREDVVLDSPVGTVFPAFTVHELRAGAALSRRQRLDVAILNLGNALYAEAPNIGFFRPEPKRNLLVSLTVGF